MITIDERMKNRTKILLTAIIVASATAPLVMKHRTPHKLGAESAPASVSTPRNPATKTSPHNVPQPTESAVLVTSQVEVAQTPVAPTPPQQRAVPQNLNQNQNVQPGEVREDLLARVALSLVGTGDPGAEAYWMGAIFDPTLSDQEREDLMEDLNEEGLANPRQAMQQDLPLIMNRLAIIEAVAPYADPFMQEHLFEAYKDLMNLASGGTAN